MKPTKASRKLTRRPSTAYSACGVVVKSLDEQVSPTQILVLPAVPLPGRDGEKRST